MEPKDILNETGKAKWTAGHTLSSANTYAGASNSTVTLGESTLLFSVLG